MAIVISILVVLLLAAAAVCLWLAYSKKQEEEKAESDRKADEAAKKLNIHLRDAEIGDFIVMDGVGPNLEDVAFKITGLHTYQSGGASWGEAYGYMGGSKPVFLEFVEDDEIELFVKIGSMELTLRDLGIDEDFLWKCDDDEEGEIEFQGETFEYEDSEKVVFFKDGEGDGEEFYSWDFRSDDMLRSLSFEKYEGDRVRAGVCTKVDYRSVTVTRE